MAFDADQLMARRRLKRQLGWWRVIAVVAVAAAIVAAGARFTGFGDDDIVARLSVRGVILEDPARDAALADIAHDDSVLALVVHINSPGGTVVGGEDLFNALRGVAEQKPVVAVMGTIATSAGYMTAIAADRLFARRSTITGSIGVIMQTTDVTGLLERLGIKAEAIKSAPLKGQPSPFEVLSPEGREAANDMVAAMFAFFVGLVEDRRPLDSVQVRALADGRVFTGSQAVDNGLVDEIGGESAARAWLAETRGVPSTVPIEDLEIERDESLLSQFVSQASRKTVLSKALTLDGLVSVWHPALR